MHSCLMWSIMRRRICFRSCRWRQAEAAEMESAADMGSITQPSNIPTIVSIHHVTSSFTHANNIL